MVNKWYLVVAFLHTAFLFSQEASTSILSGSDTLSAPINDINYMNVIPSWVGFYGLKTDNTLYIFDAGDYKNVRVLTNKDLIIDSNRYLSFNFRNTKYVLLIGGDIILYDTPPQFGFMANIDFKEFPPKENPNAEPYQYKQYWPWDDGIAKITASSSLYDKTAKGLVAYDESQLRQTFFGRFDWLLNINTYKRAWAEGVAGSGIGESIQVSFKAETDHMMVLNGYVNLTRMDLYTANNRLKRVNIVSKQPSFEMYYTFPDYVHFSEIIFPHKTNSITMYIEDVYKGSKFDDTCVTAIYLKQREGFTVPEPFRVNPQGSPSYKAKVEKIKKDLSKYGFLRK